MGPKGLTVTSLLQGVKGCPGASVQHDLQASTWRVDTAGRVPAEGAANGVVDCPQVLGFPLQGAGLRGALRGSPSWRAKLRCLETLSAALSPSLAQDCLSHPRPPGHSPAMS